MFCDREVGWSVMKSFSLTERAQVLLDLRGSPWVIPCSANTSFYANGTSDSSASVPLTRMSRTWLDSRGATSLAGESVISVAATMERNAVTGVEVTSIPLSSPS